MEVKSAIVTGGAQGIGKSISIALLNSGFNVAIFDSDSEAGIETTEELKSLGNVIFIHGDVSNEGDVSKMATLVLADFGQIDLLVNNAAISNNKPISQLTLHEWNEVIAVNVTGPFLLSKMFEPYLRNKNGSIVNICSTRAFMSEANTEAYSASKGAIYSLTHALSISLGPEIRVNCISPGWIDVSEYKKSNRCTPTLSEEDHLQHPAGRVGKADDIANLVIYLASEQSSFITGQNFIVDGGMTRKMIYV